MYTGDCSVFNKNVLRGAEHLNTRVPGGGDVWGGLGDVTLLEEVCHWGQALLS